MTRSRPPRPGAPRPVDAATFPPSRARGRRRPITRSLPGREYSVQSAASRATSSPSSSRHAPFVWQVLTPLLPRQDASPMRIAMLPPAAGVVANCSSSDHGIYASQRHLGQRMDQLRLLFGSSTAPPVRLPVCSSGASPSNCCRLAWRRRSTRQAARRDLFFGRSATHFGLGASSGPADVYFAGAGLAGSTAGDATSPAVPTDRSRIMRVVSGSIGRRLTRTPRAILR